MTVLYEKDETTTFNRTTDAAVTPVAVATSARGFCVQVDELSRHVRVRGRGDVTLLDAASFAV